MQTYLSAYCKRSECPLRSVPTPSPSWRRSQSVTPSSCQDRWDRVSFNAFLMVHYYSTRKWKMQVKFFTSAFFYGSCALGTSFLSRWGIKKRSIKKTAWNPNHPPRAHNKGILGKCEHTSPTRLSLLEGQAPRKLSVDSSAIAVRTLIIIINKMDGRKFGARCQ